MLVVLRLGGVLRILLLCRGCRILCRAHLCVLSCLSIRVLLWLSSLDEVLLTALRVLRICKRLLVLLVLRCLLLILHGLSILLRSIGSSAGVILLER